MGEPQHPIEAVHAARDLLEHAATMQQHADIAEQDPPAYGSALLGTLVSLRHLAEVLIDQIDQVDRSELRRRALYDHPDAAFDQAEQHLRNLRGVLTAAMVEGDRYWAHTRQVRDSTQAADPDHGQPPESE